MGVSGQRREIYFSHDPENDNDNAIRNINNEPADERRPSLVQSDSHTSGEGLNVSPSSLRQTSTSTYFTPPPLIVVLKRTIDLCCWPQLALQMVGNMRSPISRKNRARSWEEIRQLVLDLRRDAAMVELHTQ